MTTNLPGGRCLFEKNVCAVRVTRLDAQCAPLAGVNNAVVTSGLLTMTRSSETEDGQEFDFKNGCGQTLAYAKDADKVKRFNLTGELVAMDAELFEILFGGVLIVGSATSFAPGANIGYGSPLGLVSGNGVSLEVWSQAVFGIGGGCSSDATAPAYVRHVFPRVVMTEGDQVFENDQKHKTFNGQAFANPAWGNGGFNDYQGVYPGPVSSAHFWNQEAALPASVTSAGCGYITVPADAS
jgi:hypothetical protein